MRANGDYYLGRPIIDRIVVNTYPDVRSAWADTLRDRIDMLYEVGADALDSLTSAKNVAVFTYTRHYQYVLIFNTHAGALQSKELRRALSQAVDRDRLISDGFGGNAKPSTGLIWPSNWAYPAGVPPLAFDASAAAKTIAQLGPLRFKCLVRSDLERAALAIQQQLGAVGAQMDVQEGTFDEIVQSISKGDFDAVLLELISGPSLFRPYQIWHSGGLSTPSFPVGPRLDEAFDRIRYATSDEAYKANVLSLQQILVDDPPAIFLAWSERARAVSRRFDVAAEPNRDILTTLRLWRPTNALQYVNRN